MFQSNTAGLNERLDLCGLRHASKIYWVVHSFYSLLFIVYLCIMRAFIRHLFIIYT